MPTVSFECASKPSHFAYVEPLTKATEKNREKVETAVLSYSKNKKNLSGKVSARGAEVSSTATMRSRWSLWSSVVQARYKFGSLL